MTPFDTTRPLHWCQLIEEQEAEGKALVVKLQELIDVFCHLVQLKHSALTIGSNDEKSSWVTVQAQISQEVSIFTQIGQRTRCML